ncbi:excalibur calcium-binding domain-containing protein [Candidatus Woesearchaeota archaeon]|nr:excalibur calcium-binding domain-containing protein [Candidatus Woesearchaeota archaeon]
MKEKPLTLFLLIMIVLIMFVSSMLKLINIDREMDLIKQENRELRRLLVNDKKESVEVVVIEEKPKIEDTTKPKYACNYNAYNCDDFILHAQAQEVYEGCGGASNDVHRLDRDKDGLACETLP